MMMMMMMMMMTMAAAPTSTRDFAGAYFGDNINERNR